LILDLEPRELVCGTIFGSLATVFVLLTYLYLSAVSFLVGAQVDALVRVGQTGSSSGSSR
jgi:uncharacterized BrkB/YihY/UPF0761 family membrane protein